MCIYNSISVMFRFGDSIRLSLRTNLLPSVNSRIKFPHCLNRDVPHLSISTLALATSVQLFFLCVRARRLFCCSCVRNLRVYAFLRATIENEIRGVSLLTAYPSSLAGRFQVSEAWGRAFECKCDKRSKRPDGLNRDFSPSPTTLFAYLRVSRCIKVGQQSGSSTADAYSFLAIRSAYETARSGAKRRT